MPLTTSDAPHEGPVIDSVTLLPATPLGIGDRAILTVIAHNTDETFSEATVTVTVTADGLTGTSTVTVPLHDVVTGGDLTYDAQPTSAQLVVTPEGTPGVFRVERVS